MAKLTVVCSTVAGLFLAGILLLQSGFYIQIANANIGIAYREVHYSLFSSGYREIRLGDLTKESCINDEAYGIKYSGLTSTGRWEHGVVCVVNPKTVRLSAHW